MTGPDSERDTYRGPPPSVATGWLILVFLGVVATFLAMSVLVLPDQRSLRIALAILPFAGLLWAGLRYRQARAQRPHPEEAMMVPLAWTWAALFVSGPVLKLARREALWWSDVLPVILPLGVLGLSLLLARRSRA